MEVKKPKLIKGIGLTISLVSALMLLANALGYIMAFYLASTSEGTDNSVENTLPDRELYRPKMLALIASLLSLAGLVSGIFLMRYKNWARVLAQVTALLLLAFIWLQALFMAGDSTFSQGTSLIANMLYALVWSAPLVLLLCYLQQPNLRRHFE